jgi:dTDP-4-amino-4,6-dideoxygalactose transaminase
MRALPAPSDPIAYVDLAGQHAPLREELLAAVGRVLDHGVFVLGPEVEDFERAFAALCGTANAVGVNSGTDALVLALRALGIGRGDEVIVPANAFVAAASAVAIVGARPVLADVGPDYNLDPEAAADAVTTRTRALLPVHLTGRPARMDELTAVAARHGLRVVEDCAQAVLAEHRGRPVGSIGDVGCYSLHPLKTLNACGDAGAVVTSEDRVAGEVRTLRNLGLETRDDCVAWSGNSRLDSVQAAMLLVKLRHVKAWTERRRANAARYRELLAGTPGLDVPDERPEEYAVYHTFVVQADRRDALQAHLASQGITTAVHYPLPIHLQTVGRDLGYERGRFPNAERQAARILSLPVHHGLRLADLERVAAAVRAFSEDG